MLEVHQREVDGRGSDRRSGSASSFHATGGRAAAPLVLPAGSPDLIAADEKRVRMAPVGEDGDELIEVAPS